MEVFNIKNLTFTYPDGNCALNDISLQINTGEFVCLCGASGCGKTTLLKMLKPTLSPGGEFSGEIEFFGESIENISERDSAARIGYVFQDVENQIVTDKVWHELAFGLESLGLKSDEIRKRVGEMATFLGIDEWFHKKTCDLSGGQKQILNLAAVMVMQPDVLILDEPTSQLDPIAAEEFLNTVLKINKEFSTTVILTEHRLEEAFSIADRVVVMDSGEIFINDTPKEVAKGLKERNHPMYMSLPTPVRVYAALEQEFNYPMTVCGGRDWLENYAQNHPHNDTILDSGYADSGEVQIEIKSAWFRYEKNAPDVLKGADLTVRKGEIHSILGGNGSGKTTMLSLILGIRSPYRGSVKINGKKENRYQEKMGFLPQDPKLLFTKNTVLKDLEETSGNEEEIMNYARLCKIEERLLSHPYDLSGGEQQRAALCKVLLKNPEILLLDEPTKGFDAQFKSEFYDILKELKNRCKTVIMVSHDVEFCAQVSDRCSMIFDGGVTMSAVPREFFCRNHFYTTAANKMSRRVIDNALTTEEIITAFGKAIPQEPEKVKNTIKLPAEKIVKNTPVKKEKSAMSPATIVGVILSLLLVPLTIVAGMTLLKDERYYFISALIILESLVPFILAFEGKKPCVRELVITAVLCAIAVAGRVVFAPVAQIKPMLAVVIVSGVCMGSQTGFMVGTISAFVSNFFFGQGPWTPWQMFSFAICGFLAGIIFSKEKISETAISIYGFLASMVLYSGLVNFSSIMLMGMPFTWESAVTIYSMGLPFDFTHAVSTAVFLWLIAKPMSETIKRINKKYGIKKEQ